MNTYNIPLTQDQRDYLLTLCATVPDDDAVAQEMLGECGLDVLEDVLRSAEPVQEDALQRLEKWLLDAPIEAARVTIRTNGLTRHEAVLEKDGAWVYETRDTIADTINAALDEVEASHD